MDSVWAVPQHKRVTKVAMGSNGPTSVSAGLRLSGLALGINLLLALGKIVTGVFGNSYALIADGIESTADVFSSFIVWVGLRISVRPADERYPFGYGKAESIAAVIVSLMLLGAAALIATESIREIRTPHHTPAWFTLVVLVCVVLTKETMYRFAFSIGQDLGSSALQSDAWHHRSDALTSAAAFFGISVALIGGPGFESADDWAALAACIVIVFNGVRLFRGALGEVMDVAAPPKVVASIRAIAAEVPGVIGIEKCRIRKHGLHLAMDIHVTVDADLSVRLGHEIAHMVKDRLFGSKYRINDVTVHVEPFLMPIMEIKSNPGGNATARSK